jgi:uncharacterized protein involved in exopolysaccharide biosynthesis
MLAVVADTRWRRIGYLVAAVALALLAFFPQPYVGRAKLVPQDPSSPLASALGANAGQLSDLSALFGGGRRAIDLYLAIGQSQEIRDVVIRRLALVGSTGYPTTRDAQVRLDRHVRVQSLPGGVLEVEVKTHDQDETLKLTSAYATAISDRLRSLNSQQVVNKRDLLQERFREAATRLSAAQARLDAFRRRNRISAQPETELGAAISISTGLQAQLQAKLVEQQSLIQYLGPENPQLSATRAEIAELRRRLALNTTPAAGAAGPNAGGLTAISNQYVNLYRDFVFAQSIYQVYTRVSEQVAIEEISGQSSPTVQVVEAPHLDAGRRYNVSAIALLALLAIIALFTEFYAPATKIDLWGDDRARPS